MFRSYRVGSIFGFPIEVNLSFLLMLGLMLLWMGGLTGLVVVLIAFSSVLLHELGHALMARHLGVHIAGIELHFFGGAAKMAGLPRTANDEIAIAAAGPAVSFALGGMGFVLGSITGLGLFGVLGWFNIVIGCFNLLPALPMDGGRILRALLTRKYNFARATDVSVTIARGFAILLGIYGILSMQVFLPLLAVMLWFMGSAERRMAELLQDQFGYDPNGYRFHGGGMYGGAYGGMDDGWPVAHWPARGRPGSPRSRRLFTLHRPVPTSGFVIRRRNGRIYIDLIDPE